ncbi:MAG: glycine cleavage system aminomethyltransferase GcvT [Planctomycetaceae bacterium]|nr:glycine cleavage system aminomethyltransferase GcvT [Planctomycetaceae bacterium]
MLNTALHDWHSSHGGRMVDFAGWQMPVQFTSIVEEHHAVRQGVGLFDIAHMGRLWFSGPDAERFLDHILTNHVAKMKVGQVRYSLVCRADGGILDDVLVYRFDDRFLLVVNASNRQKIVHWVDSHRGDYDVEFTDETEQSFMVAIQGPQALPLLQPHTETDLGSMKYYGVTQGQVAGHEATISRTGYTGEDGFEVIISKQNAESLWDALLKESSGISPLPCGLGCRDTLRLEAAMPLYGHEMDESVDPITAGLGFGVKLDKDVFIGKEAIAQVKERDDLPHRIGLKLSGKRIARQGAELYVGETRVGHVSSGTFSPTLQESIAMGYLPVEYIAQGTAVDVDIRGKREPAHVVALPFYKRS